MCVQPPVLWQRRLPVLSAPAERPAEEDHGRGTDAPAAPCAGAQNPTRTWDKVPDQCCSLRADLLVTSLCALSFQLAYQVVQLQQQIRIKECVVEEQHAR